MVDQRTEGERERRCQKEISGTLGFQAVLGSRNQSLKVHLINLDIFLYLEFQKLLLLLQLHSLNYLSNIKNVKPPNYIQ